MNDMRHWPIGPNLSTADFLRSFHGDDGFWPIVAIKPGSPPIAKDFVNCPTREADLDAWTAPLVSQGYNLYFSIGAQKAPIGKKAGKSNIACVDWLFSDLDPPDELSGAELIAWRDKTLLDMLEAKHAPPASMLVDLGRGLWAYWRLKEPIHVAAGGQEVERFESRLRHLAISLGGDESCAEVSRIARLPGFPNMKTGATAKVLAYMPNRVYCSDQFALAPEKLRKDTAAPNGANTFADLIDDDEAIAEATDYLLNKAPLAIEGKAGRATMIRVANRCRDFGCSLETAALLMDEHWNDRCSPPWDLGEIEHEARGLRREHPEGCDHPRALERTKQALVRKFFEPILAEASASAQGAAQPPAVIGPCVLFHGDFDDRPLKNWLVAKVLPAEGLAFLSAQWGMYKTFLAFDLAAAVMARATFAGAQIKRQGGVLFLAAESQDEVRARLQGVIEAKLRRALPAVNDQHLTLNVDRLPFAWFEGSPRLAHVSTARQELRKIVREASDGIEGRTGFPLALIIIDTFMAAAGLSDANDRAESQNVMNLLQSIAREFRVLVLVVDHFGKDPEKGTAGASSKEAAADSSDRCTRRQDHRGQGVKYARRFAKSSRRAAGDRNSILDARASIGLR